LKTITDFGAKEEVLILFINRLKDEAKQEWKEDLLNAFQELGLVLLCIGKVLYIFDCSLEWYTLLFLLFLLIDASMCQQQSPFFHVLAVLSF